MVNPYLFQSEMSDVAPKLNKMNKYIGANLGYCYTISQFQNVNGGRVPYGELNKHLDSAKRVCPVISRRKFNRAAQLYWSSSMSEDYECVPLSNENYSENSDYTRQKYGRPFGYSIVSKH